MAYNTNNPPVLVRSGIGNSSKQMWYYSDGDTVQTMIGSNYFTNAYGMGMRIGDIVIMVDTTSNYTAFGYVSSFRDAVSLASGSDSVAANAGDATVAIGEDTTTQTISGIKTFTGANVHTGATINGVPVAESQTVDPSQKVTWCTDFLGDLLPDEIAIKAGSGTGNAVALSAGQGGRLSIASASDDGAITANASAMELSALDWRADSGGLAMEVRIQCDDISEAYIFIGFTDASQATTLEEPIFLNGANIDSTATNACGMLYDVDGTTEQWCHGGVKAGTDTTPAYSGAAPTEDAYETIRVEVSSAGAVQGFVNGTAVGDAVANAVTATTPLLPIIVVANRSANQVTCLVDYFWVQADR